MKQNEKIGKFYVLIAVALLVASVAVAVSLAGPAPYPGTGPAPTPTPTPAPGAGGPAPYPTPAPTPTPTPTPGQPDLVVEAISTDFTTSPGNVIIDFVIHNNGTARAGSSHATKYMYDSTGALVHIDHASVHALGPSGRFYGDFAAEPCPPGEIFTVRVEADNYHVVAESDETNNNMTSEEFTCPEGPQPGGPDLEIEKTVNVVGDTFVVDYTVTNIGNEVARASRTTKYVNGVSVETQPCPRLGTSASFSSTFGPEPCPCGQTLNVTICADNYNVVNESDETNNCEINEVICPLAVPEIEVIKTVWDGTAWVDEISAPLGTVVRFNSTIHNSGFCCNLTNIHVRDVLDPCLAYVGVLGATPAPNEEVTLPDGSTELRWFLPGLVLEQGDSEIFLIAARVRAIPGCDVNINTQYASARAECTGESVEDDDSAIVNVVGRPSIEVTKTVRNPDTGGWVDFIRVSLGDDVTYSSTIHNDGTCCDLTNIVVTDILPWGVMYLGVGPGTPPPQITINPTTFETELAWLIPGPLEPCESRTFLIDTRAVFNGFWTNTQEAHAWSECTQTTVTDRDDADVRIVDPPEVNVRKFCAPYRNVPVGTFVTCDIDVDNRGDWTLNSVEVVDTLPVGMSYHSSNPTADDVAVNPGGTTITWNNIGSIVPNGGRAITLVARMDAGPAGETLWNRVDVTGTWRSGTVTDWVEDWVDRE